MHIISPVYFFNFLSVNCAFGRYIRVHTILALAFGASVLPVQPSKADPSITYTGNVTPVPPPGVADWDWSLVQVLTVGDNGAGTLDIRNGATAFGDTLFVGSGNAGLGGAYLTVNGKDSAIATTHINLGDGGDGTLTVSNSGLVTDTHARIGYLAGSTGTATVEGAGSKWVSVEEFTVGYAGGGELVIKDGGVASNLRGFVGRFAGSTGTVTVDGIGSEWTAARGLHVGDAGTGILNIVNGGMINIDALLIGVAMGGNGTVTVDGAHSVLNSRSDLSIGQPGKGLGTLNILNGGTVSASGNLGVMNGTLTVDGIGSALVIQENSSLYVGEYDSGILSITNGGRVISPTVNVARTAASGRVGATHGTINIGSAAGSSAVAPGTLETDMVMFGVGDAHLTFNHTDMSGNYEFSPVITGGNAESTVNVYSGNTVLTGIGSDYSAPTNIYGGILSAGGAGIFSTKSDFAVHKAGMLDLRGHEQSLANISNSGTINFGDTGGTVLNITGNYTGNGGVLVMNTVLGDDNSKTDLLQVGGDISGNTNLQIINRGGLGAQTVNGIEVVSVGGQSSGTFSLVSDYITKDGQKAVVGGAYAYTLQQGSGSGNKDGNWYLTSHMSVPDPNPDPDCHEDNSCPAPDPRYNPGTPVYEGYVQTLQTLNTLPSLQQRVGNRYWNGAANPVIEHGGDMAGTPLVSAAESGAVVDGRSVWGRIEGAHSRFEANRSTTGMKQDVNSFLLQAGIDGQFYEGETGRLIGGVTGQYGKARGDVASDHGDGKIDTQGWGLGGTLTWYEDTGFYADLQAQAMWYDSDLTSATAGQPLVNGNKGFGYGFSAEAGRRIDLDNYWSLTPQAQLIWSSVTFDRFKDTWEASVSSRNGDSLNARLGLSADYRNAWRDAHGRISRNSVYVIANLYQELTGGGSGRVTVAGVDFEAEAERTWGGLGAGGTLTWADDKYALYGEGSLNTSLSNFADSYTLKATAGLRVRW